MVISRLYKPCSNDLNVFGFFLELEALGDDLALDEDTSYLDEVPAPSDTIPGEKDTSGTNTQDGVQVDEFGLPLPTAKRRYVTRLDLKVAGILLFY